MKARKTVTDRYSLIDRVRRHTPQNNRNYIIRSVRETFTDPANVERMQLGEMFGYYGHGRRAAYYAKTGKLNLPEFATVMVDGKPMVIENVPSNRTLEASIDDNGVVTHTQEILDTDPGNIVDGLHRSKAGGWSWATGGDDAAQATVTSFHGFDYVVVPNYISLDHPALMLESAAERFAAIHAGFIEQGFTDNQATDLCHHFEKLRDNAPMFESANIGMLESALLIEHGKRLELEERVKSINAMLESAGETAKMRRRAMKEAIANMPLFFSAEQRNALCRMDTPQDVQIVAAMLESLGNAATASLPIGQRPGEHALPETRKAVQDDTPLLWINPSR